MIIAKNEEDTDKGHTLGTTNYICPKDIALNLFNAHLFGVYAVCVIIVRSPWQVILQNR